MPNVGDVIHFDDIQIGDSLHVSYTIDGILYSQEGTVARLSEKAARNEQGRILVLAHPQWNWWDYTITLIDRPILLIPAKAGSVGSVRTKNTEFWGMGYVLAEPDFSHSVFVVWNDGSYGQYDLAGNATNPPDSDHILEWVPETWPEMFSKKVTS